MELFTPGHLIVLAIVVAVLFFGWKQLPDMARSVGRSLRVFKTEIKGLSDDDKTREAAKSETKAEPPAIAAPRAEMVSNDVVNNDAVNNDAVKNADVQPAQRVRPAPRPTPSPNGRSHTPASGTPH